MTLLNWKTIDKLEARVPGADTYRGELCEFDVRFGRSRTPITLSSDEDPERFRIENKQYDIAVEAATLQEAKVLLREKLAASDNFSGTWKLWMKVEVSGGYDDDHGWISERAVCSIATQFVVELTTKQKGKTRKRSGTFRGTLPNPFTGDFPKPKTHKELSQLQEGGAVEKRDRFNKDEVWVEATPELVETIRLLQRRLGESGDRVKEALSRKRFLATIEAVRRGDRLLETSLVQEDPK